MVYNNTLNNIKKGIDDINNTTDAALLEDHRDAMNAYDAEELVRFCQELVDSVTGLWKTVRKDLLEGKCDNKIDELGIVISKIFKSVPIVIDNAMKAGAVLKNKGYEIKGLDTLTLAKTNTLCVLKEFERDWPMPNWETINSSRNDFANGRFVYSGDLIGTES